jgi:hypothetical protein
MKGGRLLLILLALACGGSYIALRAFSITPTTPAVTPVERFPIVSKFELPRAYGHFIGDEIPVTLVIETTGDVVVDLINLPQVGETFGPFEVRALQLTTATLSQSDNVYRAAYTLQYFGPTPFTTVFGPLEILYAFPSSPDVSASTYTYKRLQTQPAVIHMARLGPQSSPYPVQIKGDVDDARTGTVWLFSILGAVLVLAAIGGWGWEQRIVWQRHWGRAAHRHTVTKQALQTLEDEAAILFRAPEGVTSLAGARLEHILREYMQTVYHVPAFTLTTSELTPQLNGTPEAQDLVCLLEQCEALKYQSPPISPAVERELWWHAVMLFEKLQGEHIP